MDHPIRLGMGKHRRRSKRNRESLRHNGPVSDASLESVSIRRTTMRCFIVTNHPRGNFSVNDGSVKLTTLFR